MRSQRSPLRVAPPLPCRPAGLVGVCRRPSPAYSIGLDSRRAPLLPTGSGSR